MPAMAAAAVRQMTRSLCCRLAATRPRASHHMSGSSSVEQMPSNHNARAERAQACTGTWCACSRAEKHRASNPQANTADQQLDGMSNHPADAL